MADNSAPRVLPVQIPSVAFKGRDTTDASAFRKAAENLDRGYPIGGSCVKAAVSYLLRNAAAALDEAGVPDPEWSFWVGPITAASPLSSTGGTADEH